MASDGGVVSIQMPCDPGLAYRPPKAVGPYRALRRRGAQSNPRFFHYQQHRNHYPGLRSITDEVFRDDEVHSLWWPLRVPTWNGNLFTVHQIRIRK
ncbi:MAG: hypothetical protein NT143_09845 [Actinobacteria bacterium]|nr:hypothetical protein [Actinomycetota bacterium]